MYMHPTSAMIIYGARQKEQGAGARMRQFQRGIRGRSKGADLVPPETLGKGMSLFRATTWVGGIIGFAVTGIAVQNYGAASTFLGGAVLSLVAALLLALIRKAPGTRETAPTVKKPLAMSSRDEQRLVQN